MNLQDLFHRAFGARISIVHEFHKPPYGGGNQFLLALRKEWRKQGLDVGANAIGPRTRFVLFNSFNFDFETLRRQLKPGIHAVHRVDGPISKYRGKDRETDELIARMNDSLAHATIFQSRYSLLAHEEMGLKFRRARVIPNACDGSIFHDRGRISFDRNRKIRVVASSWSDNPVKGKATFEWLDRNLDFDRYEVTFIGRVQASFANIKHVPAVPSEDLAAMLRNQDIYLAASANDPCSNALIEALSCGLPAVFLKSGGHPEIVGSGGLGFEAPSEIPVLLDRIAGEYETYRKAIRVLSMTEVATLYLDVLNEAEH